MQDELEKMRPHKEMRYIEVINQVTDKMVSFESNIPEEALRMVITAIVRAEKNPSAKRIVKTINKSTHLFGYEAEQVKGKAKKKYDKRNYERAKKVAEIRALIKEAGLFEKFTSLTDEQKDRMQDLVHADARVITSNEEYMVLFKEALNKVLLDEALVTAEEEIKTLTE